MTSLPPPSLLPHLLTLPYDIRHLIYTHLFPPSSEQIYIQAHDGNMHILTSTPETHLAVPLFRTCRRLHAESAAFFYSAHLFNLVGTRTEVLARYAGLLATMRGHAAFSGREVRVDAFSNGSHSRTVCVSMQVGEGKVGMLERRNRGVRREMAELVLEERLEMKVGGLVGSGSWGMVMCWLGALVVVLVAWFVAWGRTS